MNSKSFFTYSNAIHFFFEFTMNSESMYVDTANIAMSHPCQRNYDHRGRLSHMWSPFGLGINDHMLVHKIKFCPVCHYSNLMRHIL